MAKKAKPSKELRDLLDDVVTHPESEDALIPAGEMPGENGRIVGLDESWTSMLCVKEVKGPAGYVQVVKPIAANVATILVHDPRWVGVTAYDEFAETLITTRPPPWRAWDCPAGGSVAGDWCDADTARLKMWLSTEYRIDMGTSDLLDGVLVAAHRKRIHPVRDWLGGLRWDGEKRVPTWLVDIMGCEDTPYTRAVGQAWALSAVARAYKPGCKVDTVLVLEGKPGTFKSSVLRALVGDEWFLEMAITDVSNKDALQVLRRKWIGEFPEIDGLSRQEQAAVKSYFSRQVDTYRESYGRRSRDFPRQTVFAATTNKHEWLTDETGGTGRRMWPVRCGAGDVGMAMLMREQFWAEARTRLECGEKYHITDPELVDAERAEQDERFRIDPWEETIAAWLFTPSQVGSRAVTGVSTSDVLAGPLNFETSKRDNFAATRVGSIMRRLGWVPGKQETRGGARVRLYRPVDGSAYAGSTVTPGDGDHENEPDASLIALLEYRESVDSERPDDLHASGLE